uniref:Uncharacterized protein n=1 Tax=Arundo donax TaxID=35708 RepID=A0A0A9BQ85_ARUDO
MQDFWCETNGHGGAYDMRCLGTNLMAMVVKAIIT